MAHSVHNIVRCFAFGLVDDERAVKRPRLWLACHGMSLQWLVVSKKKQTRKTANLVPANRAALLPCFWLALLRTYDLQLRAEKELTRTLPLRGWLALFVCFAARWFAFPGLIE